MDRLKHRIFTSPCDEMLVKLPQAERGEVSPYMVFSNGGELFWWFCVGHALCDYGLQSEFIARGKNHRNPLPDVPWFMVLGAHALMHGGAVALIASSVPLGVAEFLAHFASDYAKSAGWFGSNSYRSHIVDQVIHVAWKAVWVSVATDL